MASSSIATLLADLKTLQMPARTILIREGDAAHQLYFIREGAIPVWINKGGKDITLQFFFEGQGAASLESFLSGEHLTRLQKVRKSEFTVSICTVSTSITEV